MWSPTEDEGWQNRCELEEYGLKVVAGVAGQESSVS